MNWHGKVAIVTGASSGIGLEAAKELSVKGATAVLAARRKEKIDSLAEELRSAGGRALAVATDVSNEGDVERLFSITLREFGRVDWLINNAGFGLHSPVEETTPEQMDRIWRTNFMGTFYCIRRAIPVMRSQGSGHILTVSSMAGARGIPMMGAYCATKFAQIGLMDSLRRELQGIHCTIVIPGATETEFIKTTENPRRVRLYNRGPVRKAKDVARAIIHAMEHPTTRVVTQKFGRTLMVLNALSPDLTDKLTEIYLGRKR